MPTLSNQAAPTSPKIDSKTDLSIPESPESLILEIQKNQDNLAQIDKLVESDACSAVYNQRLDFLLDQFAKGIDFDCVMDSPDWPKSFLNAKLKIQRRNKQLREKSHLFVSDPLLSDCPLESLLKSEKLRELAQFSKKFHPDDWELITLCHGKKWPYQKIASHCGKSEGAVKQKLHRLAKRFPNRI